MSLVDHTETEKAEYVDSLQNATLKTFGISIDEEECLGWLEADATVDQAVGWINHGCGPGDFAGSREKDPSVAWGDA